MATKAKDVEFINRPLPGWVKEIRPHQQQAVEEIVDAFSRVDVVFLDAPVGCLHGDMELIVNRGGKGFRLPIREFVHRFNGGDIPLGRGKGRTTKWDPNIPTRVAFSDGSHVRSMEVARAFSTGVKECWKLTTVDGRELIGSAEHPLLEREGGWTELLHLEPGMFVAVRGEQRGRIAPTRVRDEYVHAVPLHPYKVRCGPTSPSRVIRHRIICEARMSGLTEDEFLRRVRAGELDGLTFLDPSVWEVHHVNHDHFDNRPENLVALTVAEHRAHHADERSVLFKQEWAEVATIEPIGEHETFDLTMVSEPHSYIANGFVVHNSGKTLIAELVRREMETRALYVCSDKQLQDQFVGDFPYAAVLKGRANYPTQHDESRTADDCDGKAGFGCTWCDSAIDCAYQRAKGAALESDLAVVNTSYLLTEANGSGMFSRQPFIVADECDVLEQAMLGHLSYEVPRWAERDLRLIMPRKAVRKPTMVGWLEGVARSAGAHVQRNGNDMEAKLLRRWGQFITDTRRVAEELRRDLRAADTEDEDSGRWIRDYDTRTFKLVPVVIGPFGARNLWRHGSKWLLMSGTIISAQQMADDLGLAVDYEVVEVPMTFPVENRPVVLAAVAELTYKADSQQYDRMATAIHRICEMHDGERVLVHTVSYKLTQELETRLRGTIGRPLFSYQNAQGKLPALERYRQAAGSVLLAPSMSRGVDLRDDDCRVVVIAKVPYPSLGDRRVGARLRMPGGDAWYAVTTIRDIVQMSGRGVRSATDHATTYILDAQFMKNTWRRHKPLFPRYWRDAVDSTFNPRQLFR